MTYGHTPILTHYEWMAHRCIPAPHNNGMWTRYQYYANEYIHKYHPANNPWDHTISQVIQNFSANCLGRKLLNPILQTEDSIYQRRKSHSSYRDERAVLEYPESILFLFIIAKFLCANNNFPGSQITFSRDRRGSIHKTFHDHKYLLLPFFISIQVLDILVKIPLSFKRDSIEQISNKIPRIVSRPNFPRYFSTLLLSWIPNSKSPLYPKNNYRITS